MEPSLSFAQVPGVLAWAHTERIPTTALRRIQLNVGTDADGVLHLGATPGVQALLHNVFNPNAGPFVGDDHPEPLCGAELTRARSATVGALLETALCPSCNDHKLTGYESLDGLKVLYNHLRVLLIARRSAELAATTLDDAGARELRWLGERLASGYAEFPDEHAERFVAAAQAALDAWRPAPRTDGHLVVVYGQHPLMLWGSEAVNDLMARHASRLGLFPSVALAVVDEGTVGLLLADDAKRAYRSDHTGITVVGPGHWPVELITTAEALARGTHTGSLFWDAQELIAAARAVLG